MIEHVRRPAWVLLRRELAEFLMPQRCVACGAFGAALHDDCLARLPLADGIRCARCWMPCEEDRALCTRCSASARGALEARRAAFHFDGAARRAILEAKFRGVRTLLEPLSAAAAAAVPRAWGVRCVVPVPLHASRERERGFNQGALIASSVASALGIPVRGDLVARTRQTRAQAALGRDERARNVEGAFTALRQHAVIPPSVLLVDDVMTTGATLEAVAMAVREAGASCVYALTLAIED